MKNYPEGTTPSEISRFTSINVNTIKSILPKMVEIRKIHRGLYKVVNGGDGVDTAHASRLTHWNFHNCILSTQLTVFHSEPRNSTQSCGNINLKFVLGTKGKATMNLSSENPLNISSISLASRLFIELLKHHTNERITAKNILVKTIEFNKDYSNLRLDGLRCVTVDSLVEQFKVYQKKLGLRIEHKTKVHFNVENIVEMLTNNPNSLEQNIKLQHMQKQMNRITNSLKLTNELLFKITDRRNGK